MKRQKGRGLPFQQQAIITKYNNGQKSRLSGSTALNVGFYVWIRGRFIESFFKCPDTDKISPHPLY